MGRIAERIHTDQAEIARLEALIALLPNDAHVELTLDDGGVISGTVAARPTVQVFEDPHGNEGLNALVRIEDIAFDPAGTAVPRDVWIDRIVKVVRTTES
ncbi:DUF3247 family protein [Marilutibacter chinensis]|uniref:DUF3247 family protein n=1 Tax=Marilutibacter chinensis TaxID=2912247 RepID=A0ABS9HTP3_9GAMM|nr:DUF3247 family protein [Lysobacter chinensis]MCF7222269.1 DUF3247 family protein [Lysobacter chinensis]